ncbi:AAA family ATPase [Amycolatopsis sp., V23-08]|uniref:AAA family ATPase n=1 Tax=Amycolatopsis heterodermiae TaxID=3110235 RepID=A0ABU5RCJ0_9PSEU|nr:AAA family ATPase [Amycolatopsis sp., V23-08]MEA5363494.1 AAA family ATPase [Amycolatopsis sp., V23-08]
MLIRSPELVGRDAQLRELATAFDAALAGRGGAAFVTGESGIGKSRLAREAAARAAGRGARVLRGQGSSVGPVVPFRPLAEALLSLTRETEPVDVGELGPYRQALGVLVPDWRSALAHDPAPPLLVVAEAVLRLLSVVGRAGGCVLVLDDLHDADAETLFVLEYLVGNLESTRVLLIGTIGDEPSAAREIARSAARRGVCTLRTLSRLGPGEVHAVVAACLGTDRTRVPAETATHLWQLSAGIPFLVEELLHELVHDRLLAERRDGWHLADTSAGAVPAALVGSVASRMARLGPEGSGLLTAAAVFGLRFAAPVVQRAAGADDRTVAVFLDAAVEARLLEPDPAAIGWYAFRHPLTVEAVLARLGPTRHADLARLLADAAELLHPGLPGAWCAQVAHLRQLAGDRAVAGRLFADAGHRALETADAGSAITSLERADALLTDSPDLPLRGAVLESLIHVLGEAGKTDRAFALTGRFSEVGLFERAAVLHARVAWAAYLAGRTEEGLVQVTAARTRHGSSGGDRQRTAVDAVHALLLLGLPGREDDASRLAAGALEQAGRHGDPVAACQAALVLGILARDQDPAAASEHFERARQLTETHRIPLWRTHVLLRMGEHSALADGDTGGLALARQQAERSGAVAVSHAAEAGLVLHGLILGGDFHAAGPQLARLTASAAHHGLGAVVRHAHVLRAVTAAHRADRAGMAEAIADARAAGGDHHPDFALCVGLAQAICAVLEEDREQARRDLKRAGGSPAAGHHGLRILLDVLAGGEEPGAPSAAWPRWDRQFTELARAVACGRRGDVAGAEAAMRAAREAARPYRMAMHLGARLVAEAALTDGWGDPVTWLRTAEEYFHDAAVPAVAGACRALLRRAGESVRQRRPGLQLLPRELRDAGVTVREYDVFRLLAHRLGNTDIARRLLISPKTVEKHVSSLMAKTKLPDRVTLFDYAAAINR